MLFILRINDQIHKIQTVVQEWLYVPLRIYYMIKEAFTTRKETMPCSINIIVTMTVHSAKN